MGAGTRHRWQDGSGPPDGTYEAQFERFETTESGTRNDRSVLLVVDPRGEERTPLGSVVLPTDRVPRLTGEREPPTALYRAVVEDGRVVDLTYLPDRTESYHDRVAADLRGVYE